MFFPSRPNPQSPAWPIQIIPERGNPCPVGTPETSPAFQRRVGDSAIISPEGTIERARLFQPSLRDSAWSGHHLGVKTPSYFQMSLRDKGRKTQLQKIVALVKTTDDRITKIRGEKEN